MSFIIFTFTITDGQKDMKGTFVCKHKHYYLVPSDSFQEVHWQLLNGHTYLRHIITLTYCHRRVIQGLEINRHTIGRTDLILAAIATTNICHIIVLADHQPLQSLMNAL